MTNLEAVRAIYEAFGRGDVPGVLDHLAEDVVWEYGVASTEVPWLQPRRGRGDAAGFFEALAALDIEQFVPKTFCAAGDVVVVLVDLRATVRNTGRPIVEEDEAHVWHFQDGKVARFRHRADTHQHLRAYRGEP